MGPRVSVTMGAICWINVFHSIFHSINFMLLLLIFNVVFIYFLTHKAYTLSADGKRPDIGIDTETEKVSDSLLRNYTRHLFCFVFSDSDWFCLAV